MNIEGLRDYLLVFSKEGYAKDPGTKNDDGSKTIRHSSNDNLWNTVDTYWGGEPYAGCETVSHQGKPVWSVVYYGFVSETVKDIGIIYGHLRKALDNTDKTFPVRGPEVLEDQDLVYKNHWHGDLNSFEGKEQILQNGKEVYSATYLGGLVNQRED